MDATSERITFTSVCGNCGADSHQDWDRQRFGEQLRRDTLQLLCIICGRTWEPDAPEQERLINHLGL
jgi:hypothetical protein